MLTIKYCCPEPNSYKQADAWAKAATSARKHLVSGEAFPNSGQHHPRDVGGGLHTRLRAQRVHGAETYLGGAAAEAQE